MAKQAEGKVAPRTKKPLTTPPIEAPDEVLAKTANELSAFKTLVKNGHCVWTRERVAKAFDARRKLIEDMNSRILSGLLATDVAKWFETESLAVLREALTGRDVTVIQFEPVPKEPPVPANAPQPTTGAETRVQ